MKKSLGSFKKYASTYTKFNQKAKNILMTLVAQMDYGINRELTERFVSDAHDRIMDEYKKYGSNLL